MPAVRGVGELARFGGHVTGFAATNFLVRNVDKVLVARLSGASAAGLYDRSYRLMMMPLQSITGPLYRLLEPMMARLWSAPERYRRAFLLACRAVVLLTVPGVIVAAVLSERLMPWLLGANWAGAGAIFFWLGLAAVLQPVGNLTGLLFLTSQQSRAMMHWGFVSAITTLIGFAVGAHWGAVGIAASFFWTSLLRLPLLFAWCTRTTPVRAMDLWKVQIEPLIGATICALAAVRLWGGMPFLPLFAVTLVLAYIGAALTSCISRQGRQETIELAQLGAEHLRTMLGRIFPTLRSREA
jgi:PST family polysaccharide transporter